MKNGEAYVRFTAPITDVTSTAFFEVFDILSNLGLRKLHLLLLTAGGSVDHGLAIYNYIKGRPIEVVTYNIGNVDSIGVSIYCVGSKRVCVPVSKFTIHRIEFSVQANTPADHFRILEKHQAFDCDAKNIRAIISTATEIPDKDIAAIMLNGQVWNAQTAVERKLAHEIKPELVPPGVRVDAVIHEKGYLLDLPIQQALGSGVPPGQSPPVR